MLHSNIFKHLKNSAKSNKNNEDDNSHGNKENTNTNTNTNAVNNRNGSDSTLTAIQTPTSTLKHTNNNNHIHAHIPSHTNTNTITNDPTATTAATGIVTPTTISTQQESSISPLHTLSNTPIVSPKAISNNKQDQHTLTGIEYISPKGTPLCDLKEDHGYIDNMATTTNETDDSLIFERNVETDPFFLNSNSNNNTTVTAIQPLSRHQSRTNSIHRVPTSVSIQSDISNYSTNTNTPAIFPPIERHHTFENYVPPILDEMGSLVTDDDTNLEDISMIYDSRRPSSTVGLDMALGRRARSYSNISPSGSTCSNQNPDGSSNINNINNNNNNRLVRLYSYADILYNDNSPLSPLSPQQNNNNNNNPRPCLKPHHFSYSGSLPNSSMSSWSHFSLSPTHQQTSHSIPSQQQNIYPHFNNNTATSTTTTNTTANNNNNNNNNNITHSNFITPTSLTSSNSAIQETNLKNPFMLRRSEDSSKIKTNRSFSNNQIYNKANSTNTTRKTSTKI